MNKSGIHIKKSHEGLLHKNTHTPQGEKISAMELHAKAHSPDPAVRKRAIFALNARKWHHGGVHSHGSHNTDEKDNWHRE